MSTSFIDYKGKGYWIHDFYLSIMARYLIQAYKKIPHKNDWRGKMKDQLIPLALGGITGAANLYLDENLDRPYKVDEYIEWILLAKDEIEAKGDYILKSEINSFDYYEKSYFPITDDIETKIILELYDELINIIKGISGGEPNSKSVLPFNKID